MKKHQQTVEINTKITKELESLADITVKEGESLPDLSQSFADMEMIDPDSVQYDIQNVDVTVPGTYEVNYTFNDVNGQSREKSISCTVTADLKKHVEGMVDVTTDYGEALPDTSLSHDEYVESVSRDDSAVDITQPGTYPITYEILGKDGSMDSMECLATVLDTRPSPTPTPTAEPKKPKKTESVESEEDGKTGKVTDTTVKEPVKTGDENRPFLWIGLTLIGIGVVTGVSFWFYRKRSDHS